MTVLWILAIGSPGCQAQDAGRPDGAWQPGGKADDGQNDQGDTDGETDGHAGQPAVQPLDLDDVMKAAGEEFDVPFELLAAVAWVETRWHMVEPDEGHDHGNDPAYGVMALRGDRLQDGADLAGVDIDDARWQVGANVRAAAAWMSARADVLGVTERDNLSAWSNVIADYAGLQDALARSAYVHDDLYPVLRQGFTAATADGALQGGLEPTEVWPSSDVPPPSPALQAGPDYAGSVWRPSPNYSSRPAGSKGQPAMVIIHTCEGSYQGCWSWLTQSQAKVSAHYVVNADGSQVSQLVRESKKGWHISASYDCDRNEGVMCSLNGVGGNNFTIGIEHAGFSSQTSWDDGLLHASAKLVCDITQAHGIARDDVHIVGHGQLQPWNRTDPGKHWPWATYLELVDQYCGGQPPEPEPEPEPEPDPDPLPDPDPAFETIIVDSNQSKNDPGLALMAVSNEWVSANATPGHYNTGYWWASTGEDDDPATFWFHLDAASTRTISAWWTQGTNRSPSAPFIVMDATGNVLGQVEVDQRSGGSQWNELGTWSFPAGWNAVQLSRVTDDPGAHVVIADAIRID